MKNTHLCLLILAAHAVVLTLLYLSGPADVVMDAAGYWHLGGLCADGDFVWNEHAIAYRTPGYPAFIGAIRQISGAHAWQAVIAVQYFLLVVTAATTAWIVRQITGSSRWALLSYVLTAGGVLRSWYAQVLLTETLFIVLVTVHFACLLHCLNRVTIARCVAVGITLAAAILVRPVVQLWWLPAFGLIVAAGAGVSRSKRIRHSLVGAFAMAIVVIPWFVRNQVVFGEPFLTEFLGRNLWIVTFQDGSGANLPYPRTESGDELLQETGMQQHDSQLRHTWAVSNRLSSKGIADDEADRLMKRVCVDAISVAPGRFGFFAVRRLFNFWRCVPDPYPYINDATANPPARQNEWGNTTLTAWETQLHQCVLQRYIHWNEVVAVCVLVATISMVVDGQLRWFGLALLLFFAMVSGLTALVEIPNVRYRIVLEPLMVVTICWGAYRLCGIRASSQGKTSGLDRTSAGRSTNV